jgi:hypothetical protein
VVEEWEEMGEEEERDSKRIPCVDERRGWMVEKSKFPFSFPFSSVKTK